MNYYSESGYIDMEKIMSIRCPFIFLVHGRGTGKTYGMCKFLLDHLDDGKFLFMRRTQTEADTISFTDFSPFQPVLNDHPEYPRLTVQSIPNVKNISAVYKGELDDGRLKPVGDPVGYIGALSTIANVRGFNGEQIRYMVYDEFIPERGARLLRDEGDRILNCYETVNRNRELKGIDPLKAVFLSNANRMDSPVFQSLGILDRIDQMTMRGQSECILNERGIAVLKLKESPISLKKAETALYKATGDSTFKDMSLLNSFSSDTYLYCKREPIQEYRPVFQYEDITIYRHKSKCHYYVTRHRSGGVVRQYFDEDFSRRRMKRDQYSFMNAWLQGQISFEDIYCKTKMIDAL